MGFTGADNVVCLHWVSILRREFSGYGLVRIRVYTVLFPHVNPDFICHV